MPQPSKPVLILGSASPRRRDLLDAVGLSYEVCKPDTPEVPWPGEKPEAYALRNAREKAEWVAAFYRAKGLPSSGILVLSADTIVVVDDDILEKPRDVAHAQAMLQRLSGRSHTVISGVCIQPAPVEHKPAVSFAVRTQVWMKPLSTAEIAAYIRTGEPLDKAGAYAAQGIGSYMVERIDGSYANVVGLPIAQVVEALERQFSYPLWTV